MKKYCKVHFNKQNPTADASQKTEYPMSNPPQSVSWILSIYYFTTTVLKLKLKLNSVSVIFLLIHSAGLTGLIFTFILLHVVTHLTTKLYYGISIILWCIVKLINASKSLLWHFLHIYSENRLRSLTNILICLFCSLHKVVCQVLLL